ncbi:MAG: CRISPR-associated protein Cas4 [Bacteroidetes bacterium]|nr:CRISPR-associated protein Cas4 [Bacteroidota bacterium]
MKEEPSISGIHIAYYYLCKRKLWLWAQGIAMEEAPDKPNAGHQAVAQATTLQDTTYTRRPQAGRQLLLEQPGLVARIDYYEPNTGTVYETKPSDRMSEVHRWQLRFYLWMVKQCGMGEAIGILEYPKLRKREEVVLSTEDEHRLQDTFLQIRRVLAGACPSPIYKQWCKKCAYYDLCYITEMASE